jgi:ribose transport system permease protein
MARPLERSAASRGRFIDQSFGGRPLSYWLTTLGPWLGIVLFGLFMAFMRPEWLSVVNLRNILIQASVFVILAVGMTFVITGGGIDLSVGAMTGATALVLAWLVKFTATPEVLAILAAFAAGALMGTINGLLITRLKMPDFIATLATWIAFGGLVLVVIEGHTLFRFSDTVRFLGRYRLFGEIPMPVIVALITALLGYLLMTRTRFGRYTIAIGGNRKAAVEAGIPVERYKLFQYAFMGFLAGVAGVIMLGRLNAIHGLVGQGFEIHTIAAVIIGGTALYGGVPRIWGSVGGAILLGMLANALTFLGIHYFVQYVLSGIIIILIVLVYSLLGYQQRPEG